MVDVTMEEVVALAVLVLPAEVHVKLPDAVKLDDWTGAADTELDCEEVVVELTDEDTRDNPRRHSPTTDGTAFGPLPMAIRLLPQSSLLAM